ncbi:hypothetical protein EDD90_6685 [Streptomyces sp. Ag109_O5-1]|uniref:hypothetical protein n=1 Tax=Streptomyces sp. Ag109_O5-1 TaxID=1938851 RepID=UPI000FA5157E|nr:hypothetical protein [Streptomyces sp. Ag109_O5-1]RPE43482.1 hypothetical protein EDD90_6685 [Streptomyces sp. Ag109_O5-1]
MSMHTRVVAMAAAVLLGAGSLALAPAASARRARGETDPSGEPVAARYGPPAGRRSP